MTTSTHLSKILVVDDERPIRNFLRASLSRQYEILEAENGSQAIQTTLTSQPDLLLLDLGLPDMDGAEIIRQLREWSNVPIVVLSVRDGEQEKIAAFDAGADDYLTKPFGMGELLARIRVALRHSNKPKDESSVYENGKLKVDFLKREVYVDDHLVILTPTEYKILRALILHAGKVLTHQQMFNEVWGEMYEVDPHLLRVNVSNLRRKVETDPVRPQHIITEPGVGYRLKDIEKKL